jgi:hypothetical protein
MVKEKIIELEQLDVPFIIICGEKVEHSKVIYRETLGKWDAINFGIQFVPIEFNVIVFNDVDNRIVNFKQALDSINEGIDVLYCRISVSNGPQLKFYKLIDPLRSRFHIAANGDLMILRRDVLDAVLPIPPCIAEDSYILFKALELGYRAHFSTRTYVTTEKSSNARLEEVYKTRTTLGLYQVLKYTKPPLFIRLFYSLLPVFAPMLFFAGEDGRAWARGIEKAINARFKRISPTKF